MELDYALLADAASVDSDGKLYVMGGNLGTVQTEPPPAAISQLALVATVTAGLEEAERPSRFTVEIEGPDGEVTVPAIHGDVQAVAGDDDPVARATIVLTLNGLPVQNSGRHAVRISIDGILQQTLTFDVEAIDEGE